MCVKNKLKVFVYGRCGRQQHCQYWGYDNSSLNIYMFPQTKKWLWNLLYFENETHQPCVDGINHLSQREQRFVNGSTLLQSVSNCFNMFNLEYCNLRRTNIHTHLPIVFNCRDIIKICGQRWSQEQLFMKFWASFLRIYGFQQAKPIHKVTIRICLAHWNRKI